MIRRALQSRKSVVAGMAALTLVVAAVHAQRSPTDAVGKHIYFTGETQSPQPAKAYLGGQAVPATLVPCVNCHGRDGRGNAEGGVVPSNITWVELTKPYRATTGSGRRRPPYTDASLARAITAGIDSAGNPLNSAMPRYELTAHDMADLLAYLKVLGREAAPGVTATSIRIGTIVPNAGPGAAIGRQMTSVLSAYFTEAGEIHGRGIELDAIELPPNLDRAEEQLDSFLAARPVFALAGGLISGIDAAVERAVERAEVPLVLPVGGSSDSSSENRQRFYLSPGVDEQLYGLMRFAAEMLRVSPSRVVVVARDDKSLSVGKRVAARIEKPVVVVDSSRADALDRVADEMRSSAAVMLLDASFSLRDLAGKTDERHAGSALLLLAETLPADFFEAAGLLSTTVALAAPTGPADLTAAGLAEYRAFAARHSIHETHLAAQLSAYAAAKVVVHALKTSGRDLTRETFRAALESLYQFETGVAPPLTFGRGARVGSTTIHIAGIEPKTGRLIPLGEYQVGQ